MVWSPTSNNSEIKALPEPSQKIGRGNIFVDRFSNKVVDIMNC
jgi:hypothetical protein